MKKGFILFALFLLAVNFKVSAQSVDLIESYYDYDSRIHQNECLGVWCTLTVSASNYRDGYYYCTMSIPPEGIPPFTKPIGIGSPSFENNLGNTIDVVFSSNIVHDMLGATEGYFEFCVNKWLNSYGLYTTTDPQDGSQRCYYICVVRLSL